MEFSLEGKSSRKVDCVLDLDDLGVVADNGVLNVLVLAGGVLFKDGYLLLLVHLISSSSSSLFPVWHGVL